MTFTNATTVTYETGVNGDTATTANTSSDTLRFTASAGTATISTAQAHAGTRSLRMTGTATSGLWCVEDNLASFTTWSDDFWIYVATLPSAEIVLDYLLVSGAAGGQLGLNQLGALVMRNSAGTSVFASASGKRITAGAWFHVYLDATAGASGTLRARLFDASGTSVDDSTAVASNNGTGPWTAHRRGVKCTTTTATSDVYFDDHTMNGSAVNAAPTITGPGTINTTLSTATLAFNGNDTDGTISSFACVNQSNTANTTVTPTIGTGVVTGAGTANASVTFAVSGMTANAKYFFGGTATDNSGAVSTTSVATVNVTKDVPDIRSVAVSGFTVVGGGTALDCLLANTPGSRYLESTAPPGGASVTITFQPATPSSLAKAFSVPVKAKDTSSTETATVSLVMNDVTTIATRGPVTLTTTSAAIGGTTTVGTGSETAAITDHSKLSIVVVTN